MNDLAPYRSISSKHLGSMGKKGTCYSTVDKQGTPILKDLVLILTLLFEAAASYANHCLSELPYPPL
jgi:hypothetical protein